MNRWQQLRIELLKSLYETYMNSHTAWITFGATEEHSKKEITREADYLVEKGWVRKHNGYQLTADGRDYVEANILQEPDSPPAKIIK